MAFMLPFASCNDEDESPDKDDVETLTIDFDDGDVVLDAGEHLFYLTFSCDQNWSLSESPEVSWCTPYTTRGEAGKQEIKVYISKNTTGEKRETELTLNSENQERTLKITQQADGEADDSDQDPDEPITPVEPEDYDLVADGIYYRVASMEEAALEVTGDGNVYQGDVIIPDEVEYKGKTFKVTVIKAFNNSPVTSVKIGNNVTEIDGFNQCENLTSITIPASVESIKSHTFQNCTNLSEVILEDSRKFIHISWFPHVGQAFKNTPIKTLYWGRNCNQDDDFFFEFATQVTIGDQVTTLPYISVKMAEMTILANVTTTDYLFASTLIIENGDTDLKSNGISAETIYLGRNLIPVNGTSSYLGCDKSLTIGNKVTSLPEIGGDLESIDISSSVKHIDNITDCPNLRKVICRATTPPYGEIYFPNDTYFYGTLYVPEESLSLYKETKPWSNFIDIQPIKE